MKRVLFVGYGGGHIRMLIPLALQLAESGRAEPVFLGLNTARADVEAAGFRCLGFADFVQPQDEAALAHGRRLAATLAGHAVSIEESVAYLGLSYADLEAEHGAAGARERYERLGRQAFLPVRTLERVLSRLQPDLVVTTSAPRAERAAVVAARRMGVPCACLVDLFAAYEIEWLREPGYADLVCVLNERVRSRIVEAGRKPGEVLVTGNPAFDAVLDPDTRAAGLRLRQQEGWEGRRVWLWASQPEAARHVVTGAPGDPTLPARIGAELQAVCAVRSDMQLVVRPHPSEQAFRFEPAPRQRLSPRSEPLAVLLHACDGVVVLTSTVALEAQLAGCRVVQVLGSLYTPDAPYLAYGVADAAVEVSGLAAAIDALPPRLDRAPAEAGGATARVLRAIESLL